MEIHRLKIRGKIIKVLLLVIANLSLYNVHAQNSSFTVDATSAKMYLLMADSAIKGSLPTDAEWEQLFSSPAYKALLDKTHWNKQEFKNNVRNAFDIVYNPVNQQICDSIAGVLNDISSIQDELPFYVSTALSIKNNLDTYTSIFSEVDMDSVVSEANSLALDLVPDKGKGLSPQSSPIYFIVWDLECRALNGGLFLDVNTFFHEGLTAATEALAHEMHHFYLGPVFETVYSGDIMDGAVGALVFNMREGVADIINKKQMPLTSLFPYGDAMLKIYNDDYLASPQVLKELDEITCLYLDKKIPFEEYFKKALGCAHFEGHTTGDFMVFLIRDQLGIDEVIESVGNLDNFIDNYNKAAEKAGTFVFSSQFTDHVHDVSASAKKK